MDLIWKVGARAKEILVHKENDRSKDDPVFTLARSDVVDETNSAEPLEEPPDESIELYSDKSSTPEYDKIVCSNDTKDAEHGGVSSLASGDIKDASMKAVESAKSIGSFLYGVANRTGRSLTQTAKHLKQTVEQNSILGDFNKEHEEFVSSKASKSSVLAVPPWVGCDDEENIKQQILALSSDRRNLLRNPPSGVLFDFDFDGMYPVAKLMLKEDSVLEKMRFELVPKLVTEENFWRNYFYRVSLLKQSNRLSTMAQQKSSNADSSTWSSKKGSSDEKNQDSKSKVGQPDLDVTYIQNSEFVSDEYQKSNISLEDIKQGMKMLGVAEKHSKGDDEWEKELQQELQEFEVVTSGNGEEEYDDENDADMMKLEEEVNELISPEKLTDLV